MYGIRWAMYEFGWVTYVSQWVRYELSTGCAFKHGDPTTDTAAPCAEFELAPSGHGWNPYITHRSIDRRAQSNHGAS